MKTVLFVGAGRHQRRALRRARELGLRVAAIDRNPDAPGFAGRRRGGDRRLRGRRPPPSRPPGGSSPTACSRSPPTAPCRSRRGSPRSSACPGIGVETARLVTNKVAMRLRLDGGGRPAAALRRGADPRRRASPRSTRSACRPCSSPPTRPASAGSRSSARTRSCEPALAGRARRVPERRRDPRALPSRAPRSTASPSPAAARCRSSRSPTGGAPAATASASASRIVYPGCARRARRPPRPSASRRRRCEAIGLVDSVAYPQLLVSPDGVRLVEIAARVPAGLMDEVCTARDRRRPRRDRAPAGARRARPGRAAAAARAPVARDPVPDRRRRARCRSAPCAR